ncbi:mucin TcMUC [Trypanosoma cruzi cruzi]|nr:mucin TcMUC [Trypanosoma cruzi cruzi]
MHKINRRRNIHKVLRIIRHRNHDNNDNDRRARGANHDDHPRTVTSSRSRRRPQQPCVGVCPAAARRIRAGVHHSGLKGSVGCACQHSATGTCVRLLWSDV